MKYAVHANGRKPHFVKPSTGYAPTDATIWEVALLRASATDKVQV